MDIHSLFRKFFHINPGHPRDSFSPPDYRSEINDEVVFDDTFESLDPHMRMFEQMEDMLSKMFSSPFGLVGTFEGIPRIEENLPPQRTNPRSLMIKDDSEEETARTPSSSSPVKNFEDSLLSLFGESGRELGKSHSFSYSKFSSTKTVRLPDGTVEEHRTVIDNDGNKTTTVRRTIGDTSHEVRTKSDKQGIKEKEENFMNMDENELTDFDKKWTELRTSDAPANPPVPAISLPESSPSYLYLLKKFFGPFQKDEMKWI